jgi:hypothetical protein
METEAMARALSDMGIARIEARDLVPLPATGLAHRHWRIGESGFLLRVAPRADDLAREGAAFARAAASGHAPRLIARLPASAGLPRGALVVEHIAGRKPRLPADLPALARALAAIHDLALPTPDRRTPLADPDEPFAATLALVEANLRDAGDLAPAKRAWIDAERDWAGDFARAHAGALRALPKALVVTDAHPGNALITRDGRAVYVDLERAQYGAPLIDLAHASLQEAVDWDSEVATTLAPGDITAFEAAYFALLPAERAATPRPFMAAFRRLTRLRTLSAFARIRALRLHESLDPPARDHARALFARLLDD